LVRSALWTLAVLRLATPGPAFALRPAPSDTLYVMPPIIVEAPRIGPSNDLRNRSGFVASVEMGERRGRVEDLSHVLSQLVGVRVNQYGGLGSFATVSIRGSSSSQVKVFLDGVPLDDAYLGVTDVSQLPLAGVDRVDVYRGFTPPALGSSAIGGAINLVTRVGGRQTGVEVHESYGSFDTSRHRLSLWSRPRGVRLFAHLSLARSLGDFEFMDDNGTPAAVEDDETTTRANNGFEAWNALARAEVDAPGLGEVVIGHTAASRDRGVPGLGSLQSQRARSERTWRMSHVLVDPDPWWRGRMTASAMGFYSHTTDRFADQDGSISLVPVDSENTLSAYGGRARARTSIHRLPVALDLMFEARNERFHPSASLPAPTDGPDRRRRSHTAALGAEWFPWDRSLAVSAAQRIEWQTNEFYDESVIVGVPPSPRGRFTESRESPSAGARWRVTGNVTLKGNIGRFYRLPTFLELFGHAGAVTGNSKLVPEEGLNRDVGVIVSLPTLGLLEAVYLDNDVENLILFFPNSQRTSQPVNIGSASIRGVELSASSAVTSPLQLTVDYSYLRTEDTSDIPFYAGNRLPSRPAHDLGASASYGRRWWRVAYEFHYIGANFLDRANLQWVRGRNLHNVIMSLRVPRTGFALTLEGRNLSDERVSDVGGFPLPGRSFYSTLSYRYMQTEG
jgi:iron complex outermembrane receptor protein